QASTAGEQDTCAASRPEIVSEKRATARARARSTWHTSLHACRPPRNLQMSVASTAVRPPAAAPEHLSGGMIRAFEHALSVWSAERSSGIAGAPLYSARDSYIAKPAKPWSAPSPVLGMEHSV